MIFFSCALHCEARPLIRHFKLTRAGKSLPFSLYEGDHIYLIETGVGAQNLAAALSFAYGWAKAPKLPIFLNVGTGAQEGSLKVGEAALAAKVTSQQDSSSLFPFILSPSPLPYWSEVCTVSQPTASLPGSAIYEMEAFDFFQAVSRWTSIEFIQVCKIISDTGSDKKRFPDPHAISKLIGQHVSSIEKLATQLQETRSQLLHLQDLPIERWIDLNHCSETERLKIENLLRGYAACFGHLPPPKIYQKEQLIQTLSEQLGVI